MHRTYLQGRKLTFAKALALYEKLVKRPATKEEKQRMRIAWLSKRSRPRPPK